MNKIASQLLEQISKFISDNPKTAMGLIGGGLGALGGGIFTGPGDPNETPGDRLKRRLKNALLLGGLGAGAGTLLGYGYENVSSAIPDSAPTPEDQITQAAKKVGDVVDQTKAAIGDTAKATYDVAKSPVTLTAGGVIAGGAGGNYISDKFLAGKDLRIIGNQLNADIPELKLNTANSGAVRESLMAALRSPKYAAGTAEGTQLIEALKGQFGVTSDADLLKKLQNHGVSTSGLESILNVKERIGTPEKVRKSLADVTKDLEKARKHGFPGFEQELADKVKELEKKLPEAKLDAKALKGATNGAMKFLRRNKKLAVPATILGGLGAGLSAYLNN